jgi:hypothetical protein
MLTIDGPSRKMDAADKQPLPSALSSDVYAASLPPLTQYKRGPRR